MAKAQGYIFLKYYYTWWVYRFFKNLGVTSKF